MKLILITIFIVCSSIGYAQQTEEEQGENQSTKRTQIEKGRWTIAATSSIFFRSSDINDQGDKEKRFSINGIVGYFFVENFVLGAIIDYRSISTEDFDGSVIGIGPVMRYYLGGVFYLGSSYQFIGQSGDFEGNGNSGSFNLETGYAIFLNDFVAIEPELNYFIGTGSLNGLNQFVFEIGLNVFL